MGRRFPGITPKGIRSCDKSLKMHKNKPKGNRNRTLIIFMPNYVSEFLQHILQVGLPCSVYGASVKLIREL